MFLLGKAILEIHDRLEGEEGHASAIGRTTVVDILLPIVVPMLVVVALQIPIKTLLLGLVKTLM